MGLKIVTISDTHNKHKQILVPYGDIIIHAGDISGRGHAKEVLAFLKWYGSLSHKHKILVAGNHDFGFENKDRAILEKACKDSGIIYLNDSGCHIEEINIWGSPVQPEFCNWAFNRSRTKEESSNFGRGYYHEYIGTHWDMIPAGTDILVTHGPAYGILDQVRMLGSPNMGAHVGCELLADKILEIKPKLHVSGHIHEGRGVFVDKRNTITYVNTSSLTERYEPYLEKSFVFDWDRIKKAESRGKDYEK